MSRTLPLPPCPPPFASSQPALPSSSKAPTLPHPPPVQAAKAAAAAAAPKKEKEDGPALEDDSTEITDPSAYFENRVRAINAKKAKGINPYPHKFHVSSTLPEYIAKYSGLEAGEQLTDVTVSVAGERAAAAAAPVPGQGRGRRSRCLALRESRAEQRGGGRG